VALAEDREASDLLSAQALVVADHAIAAHRTAAILAANVARDFTAAAHEAKIHGERSIATRYFSTWVDQTVTGLIRASQRAAVKGYQLLQAANAARATAAPHLTTAERRVLLGRRKRRRQADAAADDAIQHALWERAHGHAMALLASRPDAAAMISRARDAARARRRTVVAMDPPLRAARRAASAAEYTALQAFRARRQQDEDRRRAFARARRSAVLAARAQGVPRVRYVPPPEATREVHVRQVTLLLRGETPPRRARVRAAAAAAAASSGPIGTIGLL
jgi:hypothetical protein